MRSPEFNNTYINLQNIEKNKNYGATPQFLQSIQNFREILLFSGRL
jgi:hypothetical protein